MSVHICHTVSPELTAEEAALLRKIGQSRRYPVCRFELRSTREEELVSTALNAVHLESAQDTMDSIKARAALLLKLEERQRRLCTAVPAGAGRCKAGRLPV